WLVGLDLPLDEVDRRAGGLVVDRLHSLPGERPGVLDGLLADLAEAWIDSLIVDVGRLALEHAPRAEFRLELRILRVVGMLRLLLGIEVIEVAEELVEAMNRRQELVAVAEMVFAELAGGIAERFQRLGDGDVLCLQAQRRRREADLGHAGTQAGLAGDERGAPRIAALLG